MNDRTKRLGKNTILVFAGNFSAKLILLLLLPFYTKWLSVEEYGLTDVITVYVTLLLGVATCSIDAALFVFPKGCDKDKQKKYFSSSLTFVTFCLAVTAAIFVIIDFVLTYLGQTSNSFADNIWLIYIMLSSQVLQVTIQQFTRSIDKMVVYSTTGILSTICIALFAFLLIPKYGVTGYVASISISNIVASLYSFIASKSYRFFECKSFDMPSLKTMLLYSIPLIPNSVMWQLVGTLNRPVMEAYLDMHAIGIFAVANKFPSILTMVFNVFLTSWQISILEEYGKEGFAGFYNKIFRFLFVSLIIVLIFITLISKILINIFADSNFFESWKYVSILAIGVLFSSVAGLVGALFSAVKQSKYYLYSTIVGGIIALSLNYLLIPLIGLWGASFSVVFSFLGVALTRLCFSFKFAKLENMEMYIIYTVLAIAIIVLYVTEVSIMTTIIVASLVIALITYKEKDSLLKILIILKNKKNEISKSA